MPRSRRRGLGSLAAVLTVLVLVGLGLAARRRAGRHHAGELRRLRLVALARHQAGSALEEALHQLAREANRPGAPFHDRLRSLLGEPWRELDLGAYLARPEAVAAFWGLGGGAETAGVETEVEDLTARLASPRDLPGADPGEEWAAVLILEATARAADAQLVVRRRVTLHHELRMVRVGLPRPFDQLGLLAPLGAGADAAEVADLRRRLLAIQPRITQELLGESRRRVQGAARERLEAILAGMLPADEQAARTPELFEGPGLLTGFHHLDALDLPELDPAPAMREALAEAAAAEAEARRQAPGSGARVEALYRLVAATSRGLRELWSVARATRQLPRESPGARELEPFLERLAPEHWEARVTLAGDREHPLLARWLQGELRLDGVLDLRAEARPLELRGELAGRVLVLAGPGGVRLEDLNQAAAARGDRLLVACVGGQVEVAGEVRAQVLALGDARVRVHPQARLEGALLAPEAAPEHLELAGRLELDGRRRAPWPPAGAGEHPEGAGMVATLSPTALLRQEEAR